jgi:putative membrane protein
MAPNSPTTSHTEPQRFSSDELALDRTRLAHERTMMAWIRTSASMISFGFGIYKFFDYFKGDRPVTQGIVTPRRFAIFLIATGLIVLAGAAVQNWSELSRLRRAGARVPRSLAGGIAILMSIIGALALITTILRQ